MAAATFSAAFLSDINSKTTAFQLRVDTSTLDVLEDYVEIGLRTVVSKTTIDAQLEVQRNIREKNIIDTGNLLNSITSWTDLNGLKGYVLVGAFYGIYIEFGTIKMAARPFIGPAFEALSPEFIAACIQVFKMLPPIRAEIL